MNVDIPTTIAVGAFSMLLLQGIKWLIRKVKKLPEYDFPPNFYVVAIPVLNVLTVPLLALVGFEGYEIPTDWVGWALGIIRVFLSSLVTLVSYTAGLKPLTDYRTSYLAFRSGKRGR